MRAMTHVDLVRQACRDAGIEILRLNGIGYHLFGRNVDLKVVDLGFVQLRDLQDVTTDKETGLRYSRKGDRQW